jgi:hypothetical protein
MNGLLVRGVRRVANTLNAFGFSQYSGNGSAPTFEHVRMAIKNGNTTPIFWGDPVVQATGTTGLGTGYITQAPVPVALAITGGALSAGVLTFTFTATAVAPAVGATLVVFGGTSTAATANGAFTILASSTTTAAVAFSGAYTTGTATGYAFTPIAGVFVGCSYQSTAIKHITWSRYWPGTSDSNGDVTAYVVNDPNAQWSVQTANSNTTSTAVGFANVGQNIGYNFNTSGGSISNGNTSTGNSTYFADQYTLAANFPTGYVGQPFMPFRIINLQNAGVGGASSVFAGINGYDPTTAFNDIIVGFNNAMLKQLSGI